MLLVDRSDDTPECCYIGDYWLTVIQVHRQVRFTVRCALPPGALDRHGCLTTRGAWQSFLLSTRTNATATTGRYCGKTLAIGWVIRRTNVVATIGRYCGKTAAIGWVITMNKRGRNDGALLWQNSGGKRGW